MCSDDEGRWSLYGTLTHEGECQTPRAHPDVYTSIPDLAEWIYHTIGRN